MSGARQERPGAPVVRAAALLACLLAAVLAPATLLGAPQPPVRVYAAASLSNAMTDLAVVWQERGQPRPVIVLAGSATLAKHIAAGARADLYISADTRWMDFLAQEERLVPGSRVDLLGNSLVLVAPEGRGFPVELRRGYPFSQSFRGRLCTGETRSVPVGVYARQALESLGFWPALEPRVVGTDDVRAALALVERGECGAGIVYATDAAASDRVEVVARFPASTHRPIVYPAALVRDAGPAGAAFLEFLRSAPAARAVFERHGFVVLAPRT